MSLIDRRRLVAGFILGLGSAGTSSAQDIPQVFPTPPPAEPGGAQPGAFVSPSPVARPMPPVMEVPPEGVRPIWAPDPIDPIALQRHQAGKVEKKARSWHWRRVQGRFWGYPEEFEPRPLGASLYEHGKIMAANGMAARLVLYQFDFVEGTSELNPRGLDQLARFTVQLSASPFPLIVERTPDPGLAERRRYAVLAALANGPCPLPSDRVLVGVPTPNGMSGIDAHVIGSNSLTRTQGYGPPIPLQSNGVNSASGVTSGGGSN